MIILLYRELYRGDIRGAYLFYGYETLLLDNTLEYIIKKHTKKDFRSFNLSFLDGENLTENDLISSCETLPVFAEKEWW